jgi:hypothetical protein
MRSRQRLLLTSSFLVAALVPGIAEAQLTAPPSNTRRERSNTQFSLRREDGGGANGNVARERARAGDCAGALPAFDAAIAGTIEPTLRRDRGLCHEKLGSPFPAIDDYRAYLTARPDAPDAEQIRERLAHLEESVGAGGASSSREREDGLQVRGSFAVGTSDTETARAHGSNRASAALGPRPGEREQGYDHYANEERLAESADASPLRRGTGWSVGPFLMLPRFFVGTKAVPKESGFAVGGTVRYAWSPTMTFISELGYAGLGTSGQASSVGGPLVFLGVEGRIPLDRWATNQLVLGIGPGFERYTVSSSKLGLNIIEGRARFGFRHVFGPTVGLEVLVDGGMVYAKVDSDDGPSTSGATGGVIGGSTALVIGF